MTSVNSFDSLRWIGSISWSLICLFKLPFSPLQETKCHMDLHLSILMTSWLHHHSMRPQVCTKSKHPSHHAWWDSIPDRSSKEETQSHFTECSQIWSNTKALFRNTRYGYRHNPRVRGAKAQDKWIQLPGSDDFNGIPLAKSLWILKPFIFRPVK